MDRDHHYTAELDWAITEGLIADPREAPAPGSEGAD